MVTDNHGDGVAMRLGIDGFDGGKDLCIDRLQLCDIGGLVSGLSNLLDESLTIQKCKCTAIGLNWPAIFIEDKKGQFLPWFIEKAQARNEAETLLKIEGISSKEQAQQLARKAVWLAEADFEKQAAKTAPIKLLGYHIVENDQDLGEILELIEQPHQILCRLQINGKDVYIPLHEDSLQRIDHKKCIVQVELPEGLLDIYLS